MMKVCEVKGLRFGEGQPKVCLPIVGRDNQEIMEIIHSFENLVYDLVELRIDFYENILDDEKVIDLLRQVKAQLSCPLLVTYRSLREGGQVQLSDEQYLHLIELISINQLADLVDIELMSGNTLVYQMVEIAHQQDVKVILSYHDFSQTPSYQYIVEKLEHMEILGGDLLKVALMPQTKRDVITLLNVTMDMSERLAHPLITMSMGKMGVISRITGELTGSCMTFASVKKASAPGQIALQDMNLLLEAVHHD